MTPDSADPTPAGQVRLTPEGGPIDQGTPDAAPGAGQVLATPEGGPVDSDAPVPPTWHEHMKGPILGLDDQPRPATPPSPNQQAAAASETPASTPDRFPGETRTASDEKELSKWPPYRGKPVSDIGDALKYAAPIASQAEKLVIGALNLSGQGLTKLAHFLEDRRQGRDATNDRENDPDR